jgi:hypothetical protein
VDEVREERDGARQEEDRELGERGESENSEAERDGLYALPRADDRPVDEAVGVPAVVRVGVPVTVVVVIVLGGRRETERQMQMPMGAALPVAVSKASVAMTLDRGAHGDAR